MSKSNNSVVWWIVGGLLLMAAMAGKALGFTLKPGAVFPSTHEMQYAADVIARVWNKYGFQAVLTSGLDGEHRDDSLHYQGLATDWRTKNLPADKKYVMVKEVRNILGSNFDVLLEYDGQSNEHMHVEYDV